MLYPKLVKSYLGQFALILLGTRFILSKFVDQY